MFNSYIKSTHRVDIRMIWSPVYMLKHPPLYQQYVHIKIPDIHFGFWEVFNMNGLDLCACVSVCVCM